MNAYHEPWTVKRDTGFDKLLLKLPNQDRQRVEEHVGDPAFDPYQGDIRKLKGEKNSWSKRLGEYRVFYEIDQTSRVIDVFHVERRNTQTYRRGKQKR